MRNGCEGASALPGYLVIGLLALASAGCGQAPAEPPRRVIFIMLDALRADRLSALGYHHETSPELDALARGGVLFRNHFALDSHTRSSLPQMLYSRYFAPELLPDSLYVSLSNPWNLFHRLDPEAVSMPRALARFGFQTAALSAHAWLGSGTRIAAEFDELHRLRDEVPVDPFYGYPTADQVTDAGIAWLDSHRRQDFFLYLHYMDTHFPHRWGPEAQKFSPADLDVDAASRAFDRRGRVRDPSRSLTGAERSYLDALYDGHVRYVDREIGRLITFLRQEHWLEETLVVVTSDHGEHLLEVPRRFQHGGPWFEAVAHVPWILHYPQRLRPTTYDGFTTSLDVLPTILSLLETRLPEGKRMDGTALTARVLREERDVASAVYAPQGIRTGRHRLLLPVAGGDRPEALLAAASPPDPATVRGRLYDLAIDPLETRNLWHQRPGLVGELLARWHATLREPFMRLARSRSDEAPKEQFALAVRHATLKPEGSVTETFGKPTLTPDDPRWHWNRSWNGYWLGAAPGAEALQIDLAAPSATYDVHVAVGGTCRISVNGRPAVALTGPRVAADRQGQTAGPETTLRPYGRLRVRKRRLEATVEVATRRDPCVLRYFGLSPLPDDSDPRKEERMPDPDERLRALGYIE